MTKLAREEGTALVAAVAVMFIMLALGMATYSYVDTQVKTSSAERTRESSFNQSESVLADEAFQVSTAWASGVSMPDCTYSGGTVTSNPAGQTQLCPSISTLQQAFTGADFSRGVTWTVKVRDNGTGSPYFYDDAAVMAQPHRDANNDGEVWIRAQSLLGNNKRRTVVERVRVTKVPIDAPRAVVSAGTVTFSGSKKLKIYAGGAQVLVRCPSALSNPKACVTQRSSNNDQIVPSTITGTTASSVLTTSAVNALRKRAQGEGHYYTTCPSNPPGPLVFIEGPANCGPSSLPPTGPNNYGVYVLASGSFNFLGAGDYWGLIYILNGNFDSNGNHNWHGSINVDGQGNANFGTASGTSLTFDLGAFNALYTYGDAQVVRPSFREIDTQTP